jgi:hypothetical protein
MPLTDFLRGGLAVALSLIATNAVAQEPLSAIDWLSRSVVVPPQVGGAPVNPILPEPPVSHAVVLGAVETVALGPFNPQAPGLISPLRSGLPRGLWGATPEAELSTLLRRERTDTLPALLNLLRLVMLAELDAPRVTAAGDGSLLLARVDGLLAMGALEPAYALLQMAGAGKPEHFRRLFDIALLLGEEDRACGILRATPEVSPSYPVQIFCLARGGDWAAAVLSFQAARALGLLDPEMAALVERFLDPEAEDGADDLAAPDRVSPLVFRLLEAVGQPLPTASLPLAFAQADLRANTGWKARIEAGERLARMGSVEANQLLGLYTEQSAAATGGVWDRAAAMARLDAGITARNVDAVAAVLPATQALMAAAGLESHLATLFARALATMPVEGDAATIAFRLGMLADDFEAIAAQHTPQNAVERLLLGVAKGDTAGLVAPNVRAVAVKSAFDTRSELAEPYAGLVATDRQGEALLLAIEALSGGARGDVRQVGAALTLLRQLGLETAARRVALELLLLEPRA